MAEPKKYYTFMIDPELAGALKAVKERDGIPEGEQIRRALRAWLEEKGVLPKRRDGSAARRRSRRS